MRWIKKFEAFEKKTYKEFSSTFTHDNKEYDLNKMFKLTKRRKIYKIPITKLKWILKHTKISKNRVKKADTDIPILIGRFGKKWVTYDGVHRLSKAIEEEKDLIKVKKIPKYILDKCLINKE
jgi:hypothetical protein